MTPRLLIKQAALALFACPAIILGGCSDSLTSAPSSPSSFADTAKGYAHTLTPEQRKAAIADLSSERAKRQSTPQDEATASVTPAN
jgi:hypothetical protein